MRLDPFKYFSFKSECDIIKDPTELPLKRAEQVGIIALKILSYVSVVTPIVFAFVKLSETTHRINQEDRQDANHLNVSSLSTPEDEEIAPIQGDIRVVPSQEKVEAGSQEEDKEGASQQGHVGVVAPAQDVEVACPPVDVVVASPPIALEPVDLPAQLFDYEHPTIETVMQYASLGLKNMRSFLANKLDVNANIGKNVKLVLLPLAGFGDVLFIYKACQALKQKGFKVSIDILRSMDNPDIEKTKEQLKQLDHMDDVEIILEGTGVVNAQKPDCLIFAPTIPDKKK